MNKTMNWLGLAALLLATLCQPAVAADKASPGGLTPLTVAELRSEFWLPAYLAETLGYYKEEGLKVTFVTTKDGPVAFQGMHAGSADLTMLSTEPVLRAQAKGLESLIIMALLTNKPYMFVGAPGITSVKQLKGKTIFAGAPGSAPHSFALSILAKEGMKDTDVNWAQMDYGASLAALEKGHIDGCYMRSTAKKEIAAIGANVLVDVSDPRQHQAVYGTPRYESTIVTGTKKFVRENPETIQKFANAVVRAMIWLNQNSDQAAAEKALPMFPAGNMAAHAIGFLRPSLSVDGLISPEGHATIVSFCRAEKIIDRDIPFDEINDMSFVKKAYEKFK